MGVFKPTRTKSRPTLTYLMKQKRNLKDETDLKNSFENNSQQYISNCERHNRGIYRVSQNLIPFILYKSVIQYDWTL